MILIAIGILTVVLDQLTKHIVTSSMVEGESIPVIENIFHLTYILNPGAAFGLMEHKRWFFIGMAIAVLLLLVFARKLVLGEDSWTGVGCALFAGGTVGNLIDRIGSGLVVDFFDFRIWPVFNVADIAICVGVGCILWSTLREELRNRQEG